MVRFDDGEQEDEIRVGNKRNCLVEKDGETMFVPSPPNKRIKYTSIDRLSALPDCILIHILSFLGIERASHTSVLSKRWETLWAELPSLEFWGSGVETEKIPEFVAWIRRTLASRSGKYVEKFCVNLKYNESLASDVNVWVEFAVKNNVKEFFLGLDSDEELYTPLEMLYCNSSWKKLSLRCCIMAPKTIKWQSLTELKIMAMKLHELLFEKILLGCPVLRSLHLTDCWGFSYLNVNSRSLYELRVFECEDVDHKPLLEISAPYIHSLNVSLYPEGRNLLLRNIPSCVSAHVDFVGYDWDASFASPVVMDNMKDLLETTQHVKELELGNQCFQVLSMLAVSDWQLPQSRRERLKVTAFPDDEHNISGIVSLLESSPKLETLVIDGFELSGEEYVTWDSLAKDDLIADLQHLKTVKISNFAEPGISGEPMLTMARILLKRATILEEMTILTDVEASDFVEMGQKLLTYPRSSEKAVVRLPFY